MNSSPFPRFFAFLSRDFAFTQTLQRILEHPRRAAFLVIELFILIAFGFIRVWQTYGSPGLHLWTHTWLATVYAVLAFGIVPRIFFQEDYIRLLQRAIAETPATSSRR